MKRERKDSSRTFKKGLGRLRKGAGFTLLELMVVVVILAVLAGVAIPRLIQYPKKGREQHCFADIETLATTLELFLMELNTYPTEVQGLAYLETCTESGWTPIPWRRDFDLDDTPDTPWSKVGAIDEYQYAAATPTSGFSIWVGGSYANARTAVYKPNEGMLFRFPP